MTFGLVKNGCVKCGEPYIKVMPDDIFRCEQCGWEGIIKTLHGENLKLYYLDLIRTETASASRSAELMGITMSEMIKLMNDHGLIVLR